MDRLFRKQVLEVELGLYRAEHEVGVIQTQMLLVGVGGEGSTAARPVLERGWGGLAGERAHVGVQAAADLARVDDDDLAGAACLGVAVQVDENIRGSSTEPKSRHAQAWVGERSKLVEGRPEGRLDDLEVRMLV